MAWTQGFYRINLCRIRRRNYSASISPCCRNCCTRRLTCNSLRYMQCRCTATPTTSRKVSRFFFVEYEHILWNFPQIANRLFRSEQRKHSSTSKLIKSLRVQCEMDMIYLIVWSSTVWYCRDVAETIHVHVWLGGNWRGVLFTLERGSKRWISRERESAIPGTNLAVDIDRA